MSSQKIINSSNVLRVERTETTGDSRQARVSRVLICRPNHRLGNLLLITPLVQEIIEAFPDCKIDLFVKGGIAPTIFKNYENVDKIIQLPKRPHEHPLQYLKSWMSIRNREYDLVIDADKKSSSGRYSLLFSKSKFKLRGDIVEDLDLKFKDYRHHAKFPVYNFRNYLAGVGSAQRDKPIPPLNIKLTPAEIAGGKELSNGLVDHKRQTIALFTYATGQKCYSELWWDKFYQRIKVEFPHLNIIEVLPVQNISKLSFKAPAFYSKDIREIGSLIANTLVFIGADSGIMHLANASQTPTVGLFSVSDQSLYAPYGNGSVAINTNITNIDESMQLIRNIIVSKFNYNPVSK